MNTFNEKKWFVYVADHHEGPYSLADLQAKLEDGSVSGASYLWTEGVADWRVFAEIPETAPLLSASAKSSAAMPPVPTPVGESTFSQALHASMLEERTGPVSLREVQSEPASVLASSPVRLEISNPGTTLTSNSRNTKPADFGDEPRAVDSQPQGEAVPARPRKKKSRVIPFALLSMIFLILGMLHLQGLLDPIYQQPAVRDSLRSTREALELSMIALVERFPALSAVISPIPTLTDLNEEDFADLRHAASAQLPKDGPKMAFALSSGDMLAPAFHIASNLPDGTVFEVQAVGAPDTLLGTLSSKASSRAVIRRKLGKSEPFRGAEGKPLTRGTYEVFVYEAAAGQPAAVTQVLGGLSTTRETQRLPDELPKGMKLLSRKRYFLGGPKDETYTTRLKEFHDQLREKATVELAEVKNLTAEMEARLIEGGEAFENTRGLKNKKLKAKSWADFQSAWNAKTDPILGRLSRSPDELMKDFFYGTLYLAAQTASQAVTRVHGLHRAFFTGSVDPKAFDIQLGESTNLARSALENLKVKIDQAEKTPPSPSGMHRKEGL